MRKSSLRSLAALLLSAVVVVLGCSRMEDSPAAGATPLHSLVQRIPGIAEAKFRESGLPSLSLAIVHDRDLVYSQAFGFADLEEQVRGQLHVPGWCRIPPLIIR